MKRIDFNRKILECIADEAEKNPDYRFIQLLWAMDLINKENDHFIEDRFYEESEVTLSKINSCHKAKELKNKEGNKNDKT